jgi:uncharacterized protein (TIGR04255 family)
MARQRTHLRNAPIVEAIIDFRVVRRDDCSAQVFADLTPLIGSQYEQKASIQAFQAMFGMNDGKPLAPSQSQTDFGWRYQSKGEVAQFRLDGFTFSKIEKYTTWEEVFGEAVRLWRLYLELAKPRQVSRVAVRYINRMRLPAVTDLGKYLEAPPLLPAPIPQVIREFLARFSVEDAERSVSAAIVQALEPRVDPSNLTLLLDIDAFREMRELPDDPLVLSVFERLRQLKNEIFFATITESIAEMYE